jgi:heptosyltransferase-3
MHSGKIYIKRKLSGSKMPQANRIKKILVIRFRRVGDAVLATAICSSLRKTFPDAQIDYVLNENIALLFEGHPDIDNVITFSDTENRQLFGYIKKVWRVVRANRYDIIIDTRSTVRTLLFSLFSLATPFRIGTIKSYNFLTHNYRVDNHRDLSKDMVQHNLMLLEPLEQITTVRYCPEFTLSVTDQEKQIFRNRMEQDGIDFSRPVVLAAVTARQIHKVWDRERMKAILYKIIAKYNAQIIFNFAGKQEEVYARKLFNEMESDANIFIDVRADSLKELMTMAANCDFFFGNEGGPRHIAQALHIPSYAIFPPGPLKSVWLPASNDNRYRGISPNDVLAFADLASLNARQQFDLITVSRVWEELDPMLDQYLPKHFSDPKKLE